MHNINSIKSIYKGDITLAYALILSNLALLSTLYSMHYSTRLANGGWSDLTVQDSHLLDYPPLAGRTIRIY